jgi:hypothetical protein
LSFTPEFWFIIAIYVYYAYDTLIVTASQNIVSIVDIPGGFYFDADAAVSNKYKIWFLRFFRPWILYRTEEIVKIRPNRKPRKSQIRYLRTVKGLTRVLGTLGSINGVLILIIFPLASFFFPLSYCFITILPVIYINASIMMVIIIRTKNWAKCKIEKKIGIISDLFLAPISSINIAQKIFLLFEFKLRLSDFITHYVDQIGCYTQLQNIKEFLVQDLAMATDSPEILKITEKLTKQNER